MDEKVFQFLLESQSLMLELDLLIEKYGLEDKALCCVIQGVLVEDPEDEKSMRLNTIYNLTADNQEEVDTLKDFLQDIWDSNKGDNGLDDLLRDSGISLN